MFSKDHTCLLAILEAIQKIEDFSKEIPTAEEFNIDIKSFDACMMNFIVIGEMANKLSEPFRKEHSQIEWNGIISFRNIAAHDYFGIDFYEVWEIIKKELPELKEALTKILH